MSTKGSFCGQARSTSSTSKPYPLKLAWIGIAPLRLGDLQQLSAVSSFVSGRLELPCPREEIPMDRFRRLLAACRIIGSMPHRSYPARAFRSVAASGTTRTRAGFNSTMVWKARRGFCLPAVRPYGPFPNHAGVLLAERQEHTLAPPARCKAVTGSSQEPGLVLRISFGAVYILIHSL